MLDKFTVTREGDSVVVTSISDFGTTTSFTMPVVEALQLTDQIRRAAGLPTQDTPMPIPDPMSPVNPVIPTNPVVPGAPTPMPVGVPYKAESTDEEAVNA